MTDKSAAAARELVERWMGKKHPITMRSYVSDLTALISEHYVSREECKELLQQRDELREALRGAIGIIRTWHGIGIIDEAKEADMWRIYSSHAPEMKKLIAAIKNTDG